MLTLYEAHSCVPCGAFALLLVAVAVVIALPVSTVTPQARRLRSTRHAWPYRPTLVMPDAEHRSRQAPMRNGDPVKRRLCFQVFSRATTSPATVLIYSTPAVSARPCSEHQFTLMSCSLQQTHGLAHTAPGKTPSASRPHPKGWPGPAGSPMQPAAPLRRARTVAPDRRCRSTSSRPSAETEQVFMRTLRTCRPGNIA